MAALRWVLRQGDDLAADLSAWQLEQGGDCGALRDVDPAASGAKAGGAGEARQKRSGEECSCVQHRHATPAAQLQPCLHQAPGEVSTLGSLGHGSGSSLSKSNGSRAVLRISGSAATIQVHDAQLKLNTAVSCFRARL